MWHLELSAPLKITGDWTDTILLARLALSPATMTDDPEVLTVIASLPANETLFEYLAGCWKRERAERYKIVARKVCCTGIRSGDVLRELTLAQTPGSRSEGGITAT
mgnify:CR=1 FL=1